MAAVVAVGILIGGVCQLAMYFRRMPLWGDECALILNVLGKSGRALCFGRLDLAGPQQTQAAPPLFLLGMRAMAVHFGGANEYAMRFIPLVCGLLALPLFAAITWKLFGPRIAAVMAPVFALSMRITEHAATAKPYSSDLLVALLLLAMAMRWRRESVGTRSLRTALVAAGAFWVSFTSIFVFTAVSLWLLTELRGSNRRTRIAWLAGNALDFASFAALYWLCIRAQRDEFLHEYWAEAFPDYSHPARAALWLPRRLWDMFTYLQVPTGLLLLPIALIGAISLVKGRRPGLLIALAGPIALAALAAAVGQYPFAAKRVSLYLFPSEYLLAAAGLRWIRAALRGRSRHLWAAPALICIAVGIGHEAHWLIAPRPQSYLRPAIAYLREYRRPDEPVYVIGHQGTTFVVYWGAPDAAIHLNVQRDAPLVDKRFWIIEGPEAMDGLHEFAHLGPGAHVLRRMRTYGSLVELCATGG
jgi:4-amino-4-deoxy-L-arabinose transferase-like glycosyltransferase